MRLLLDSHAFLWFAAGSDELSLVARRQIENPDNELFLSAASLWEIAIKTSLGKVTLARPFEALIPEQLAANAILILPIELRHLAALVSLPWHHRDPFDRLLVVQAAVEQMPIVTRDPAFREYAVEAIW